MKYCEPNALEKELRALQQENALLKTEIQQTKIRRDKIERLTNQIMMALASAVDAKDKYTNGHSFRVAAYSKEIAKRMGKNEEEQESIYDMGLLHDIGKIGVPDAIIHKDCRLTDSEFDMVKNHPMIGYHILQNISEMPQLATGARWHHEHFDGSGYPDHLCGSNIPQEARIIAVCDAYDAMTSKRTYSEIKPQTFVRSEIEKGKKIQFDPEVADIMLQMIDEDKDYRMRGK